MAGNARGIAASYLPNAYLLSDTTYRVTGLWRIEPPPPTVELSAWWYGGEGWNFLEVMVMSAEDVAIGCGYSFENNLYVWVRDSTRNRSYASFCFDLVYRTGEPVVLALPEGVAFEPNTGDSLYDLEWVIQAGGFLAGKLLVATSATHVAFLEKADSLREVEPLTGTVLRSAPVSLLSVSTRGVVADPDGRRLYVAGLGGDTTLVVQVYDASSLRLIGTLTTGERCPADAWCYGVTLGPDPNFGRLYLVAPGYPAHQWTFDRLP